MTETIRAGVHIYPPFVNECALQDCLHAGLNPDLFKIVAYIAGRNVTFHQKHYYSGSKNTSQGIEYGILDAIAMGELDASASMLYLDNEDDMLLTDFSLPVTSATRGFIVRKRYPHELPQHILSNDWFKAPFSPYSQAVWLCILLMTAAILTLKFLTNLFRFRNNTLFHLQIYKALAVFFLYRAFKSQFLATSVAMDTWKPPFNNLPQFAKLLEEGSVKIIQKPRNHFEFSKSTSNVPPFPRIRQLLQWNPPLELSPNITLNQIIKLLIKNPRYVFISSYASFMNVALEKCELTFVPIDGEVRHLAFAFAKGSRLLHEFNAALHTFEYSGSDFYDRLRSKYMRQERRCSDDTKLVIGDHRAVTLKTFSAALSVYLLFCMFPIVFFMLEVHSCINVNSNYSR